MAEEVVSYQPQPPEQFTYEEYLAASAAVLAALVAVVGALAAPFQAIPLARRDWLSFLAAVYPHVESARREMAILSRRFYDSERIKHVPPVRLPLFDSVPIVGPDGRLIEVQDDTLASGLFYERLNINLAPYEPNWFEEAMDAVVLDFAKPNATDGALTDVIGQTIKEAENGARRTSLWAVEDDPRVKGWARVEGNENVGSCPFCLMLISRGPVYKLDPRNAGLKIEDQARAVEAYRQGLAAGEGVPSELMKKWHENCDCKVVPVFNYTSWPGRDKYLEYSKLWAKVTGPYLGGEKGGDKLKAFRRYLETGSVGDDSDLQKVA